MAAPSKLASGKVELKLHDLTGFEGRCDAILLADPSFRPPEDSAALASFRKQALGICRLRRRVPGSSTS